VQDLVKTHMTYPINVSAWYTDIC